MIKIIILFGAKIEKFLTKTKHGFLIFSIGKKCTFAEYYYNKNGIANRFIFRRLSERIKKDPC